MTIFLARGGGEGQSKAGVVVDRQGKRKSDSAFFRIPARERSQIHSLAAEIVKFRIDRGVRQATQKRNDALDFRIAPAISLCQVQCCVVVSEVNRSEGHPPARKNSQIVQPRMRMERSCGLQTFTTTQPN